MIGVEPVATFRLDVKYTQLASALTAAGVAPVLLKGPAFDQLLFAGRRSRAYRDIDLLVAPESLQTADRVLEQLGFRLAREDPALRRLGERVAISAGMFAPEHATARIRDSDRFVVDLHRTLPEVGTSAQETWHALCAHRTTITVANAPVETLDRTASALLIALHAAHHGPRWERARADLERACEVLDRDCWLGAAMLARELLAEDPMGVGLATTARGRALATELGLPTAPTLARRLGWWGIAWLERRRV